MSGELITITSGPVHGRGAVCNVPGRFERYPVAPFDDGWGTLDEEAHDVRPGGLATVVTPEPAETRKKSLSPW